MADAGVDPFTLIYIFIRSNTPTAIHRTLASHATTKHAARSLPTLAAHLGNVSATQTKTAGAAPP